MKGIAPITTLDANYDLQRLHKAGEASGIEENRTEPLSSMD
jgi:hypothetical protein